MPPIAQPTRKEFIQAVAGLMLVPAATSAAPQPPKVLLVVAHPDDEYAFAATVYRITRELGGVADQLIITNGEAGYRYSTLAEAIYGTSLTHESDGRANLPAIRKTESQRAAHILGIRRQTFLDQKDSGFADRAAAADTRDWNRPLILSTIERLLRDEQYDFVFVLLPSAETHGHHRIAALLTLEAVSLLPEASRPIVLGAEPGRKSEAPTPFRGLPSEPLTGTATELPAISFDRTTAFGFHNALSYQIVVNWVIAEHKSQGLFQTSSGHDDVERFWRFSVSGRDHEDRLGHLAASLAPSTGLSAGKHAGWQ